MKSIDKVKNLIKDSSIEEESKYDPEQIKMGIEVEKEHDPTIDKIEEKYGIVVEDREEIYKSIAQDHLDEFPDYYTRLDKMEKEAEADFGKGEDNEDSE